MVVCVDCGSTENVLEGFNTGMVFKKGDGTVLFEVKTKGNSCLECAKEFIFPIYADFDGTIQLNQEKADKILEKLYLNTEELGEFGEFLKHADERVTGQVKNPVGSEK
ncbi:MAG: hypothetical protein DRQ62_16015 [Gammaproteobacteria bacterium]|nr:MAG: hypothetical protein DRQ62_16015 [Gammaproteobacteria bacterium]